MLDKGEITYKSTKPRPPKATIMMVSYNPLQPLHLAEVKANDVKRNDSSDTLSIVTVYTSTSVEDVSTTLTLPTSVQEQPLPPSCEGDEIHNVIKI